MDGQAPSLSWEQELMLLRDLTKRTSILHEAQVLQLRCWARLAAPKSATDVSAGVDIEKRTVHVEYRARREMNPDLKSGMVRSIRWLLGDDWHVRVEKKDVR